MAADRHEATDRQPTKGEGSTDDITNQGREREVGSTEQDDRSMSCVTGNAEVSGAELEATDGVTFAHSDVV